MGKWATRVAPEDAWAHGQAGDAYFSQFRFNEANEEYIAASRWGMDRRGKTGQAKVLAAAGHWQEALELCLLVISQYPENNEIAHTRAQYSEILRKVGRLEEALASYEEAIELHPDEQGLRCGRAAVLTDLYRFPEALKAYDEVIRDFPSEVVPLAGRAHVLKGLGQLEASLLAYEETIERFPSDPFPLAEERTCSAIWVGCTTH